MKWNVLAFLVLLPATLLAQEGESACIDCHANFLGETHETIVRDASEGIHFEADLRCHDCHGGNPDPSLAQDMAASMDPDYEPNPYLGVPAREEIPQFCGSCHSDLTFMRRYRPNARTDQEKEYWTSQHGQALRTGDGKVATCVDCHGVHGILAVGDPESPVFPKNVGETCSSCHGQEDYMAGYETANGQPLPTDQFSRWRSSVHGEAMFEREDLSAPTCNDCHGNHGATPPGLEAISFVCGQCHGREAELFRGSTKAEGFERHNEFLAGSGGECGMCHEFTRDEIPLRRLSSFSECSSCHGNHGIARPKVTMFSPLPETPCSFCHEGEAAMSEGGIGVENFERTRARLLEQAAREEVAEEELFVWMADEAMRLAGHRQDRERGESLGEALRPEFVRLWEKFRIGYEVEEVREKGQALPRPSEQIRCSDCHRAGAGSDSAALQVAREFVTSFQNLTSTAAQADRTLMVAKRGGVLTLEAEEHLQSAIDTQIQLHSLVHGFRVEEGSRFHEVIQEGMESARGALTASRNALDELEYRRQGLAVSLIFIFALLVALALKIRQMG